MSCLIEPLDCTALVRKVGRRAPLPPSCPRSCIEPAVICRDSSREITEYEEGCMKRLDCCGQVIYANSYDEYSCMCDKDHNSKVCQDEYKQLDVEICSGKMHHKYMTLKCRYCIKITSHHSTGDKERMTPKLQFKCGKKVKFTIKDSNGKDFGVYKTSNLSGMSYGTYDRKEGAYYMTMPSTPTKLYYGYPGYLHSGNYIVVV